MWSRTFADDRNDGLGMKTSHLAILKRLDRSAARRRRRRRRQYEMAGRPVAHDVRHVRPIHCSAARRRRRSEMRSAATLVYF